MHRIRVLAKVASLLKRKEGVANAAKARVRGFHDLWSDPGTAQHLFQRLGKCA